VEAAFEGVAAAPLALGAGAVPFDFAVALVAGAVPFAFGVTFGAEAVPAGFLDVDVSVALEGRVLVAIHFAMVWVEYDEIGHIRIDLKIFFSTAKVSWDTCGNNEWIFSYGIPSSSNVSFEWSGICCGSKSDQRVGKNGLSTHNDVACLVLK